jgi:hypothetical protein
MYRRDPRIWPPCFVAAATESSTAARRSSEDTAILRRWRRGATATKRRGKVRRMTRRGMDDDASGVFCGLMLEKKCKVVFKSVVVTVFRAGENMSKKISENSNGRQSHVALYFQTFKLVF